MPKKSNDSSSSKNVLISRFSALGDIAMTIPAVYDACMANPNCNFYFLTRKHPGSLFINAPGNLKIITVDFSNYKGIPGIWKLAGFLKSEFNIDLYLDLHDVLRTKLLRIFLRLTGVEYYHLNKGRKDRKKLTRPRNKLLLQLKPTHERYREVFDRAGINIRYAFKSLFGTGKGNTDDFKSVTPPKKPGEYWLAIAPFAQHTGKIYPFHQMATVIEQCASKPNVKIFIFGFGLKEGKLIATISEKFDNVVNMAAAKIGLPAELSLLSHCDTMLSMDSANMHLASLVGLRTVSIWGATHPYTGFFGWHQNIRDAVQLDMTCRPCSIYGNRECIRGDYQCLYGITPQMIIQRLQSNYSAPANSIK